MVEEEYFVSEHSIEPDSSTCCPDYSAQTFRQWHNCHGQSESNKRRQNESLYTWSQIAKQKRFSAIVFADATANNGSRTNFIAQWTGDRTIRPTMRNNVAPYGQPNYIEGTPYLNTSSAPRLIPGQMQAVARQVKQQFKKHMQPTTDRKLEQMRASLDAQAQANEANVQGTDGNGASPSSPAWMANSKNLQVVAPEVKSAEEQAEISRAVQTINPASFEEQAAARQGTAGPPPFPLNLLPEQSLKQLLGAKSAPPAGATATVNAPRKINAPPSFFGSWHGSMPTAKAGPSSHLASSGFQSHMQSKGFAMPAHAAKSRTTAIAAKPQGKAQNKALIAQARKPELKISLYAPYNTN